METDKKKWYQTYNIPKKSGGVRQIEAPIDEVKQEQWQILKGLYPMYAPSRFAYGGICKRNIVMAAEQHVANKYVMKVDLSDFFHNVHGESVAQVLQQREEVTPEAAEFIRNLCTNSNDVLPMGAPTSMFLANLVSEKMYNALGRAAGHMGAVFTGYVDDLIFSCNDLSKLLKLQAIVKRICTFYNFPINQKKISLMRNKQEVLGLCVVNTLDHPRLPRKKRYIIKAALHNAKKAIENGETLPPATLYKLNGWIAFAHMAKDQWADRFKKSMVELNQMRLATKKRRKRKNAAKEK